MLISGAPGTGKTTTIVSMIYNLVNKRKAKIHVCAPSNTAVDGIVLKLLKSGLKEQILYVGDPEHRIK